MNYSTLPLCLAWSGAWPDPIRHGGERRAAPSARVDRHDIAFWQLDSALRAQPAHEGPRPAHAAPVRRGTQPRAAHLGKKDSLPQVSRCTLAKGTASLFCVSVLASLLACAIAVFTCRRKRDEIQGDRHGRPLRGKFGKLVLSSRQPAFEKWPVGKRQHAGTRTNYCWKSATAARSIGKRGRAGRKIHPSFSL